MNKVRALILSYSPISRDPRVLRQIEWLQEKDYELTVVGLGDFINSESISFVRLAIPNVMKRVLVYLFATNEARTFILLKSFFRTRLLENVRGGQFDFVLMNDLDFLGAEELIDAAEISKTPIVLDLHEYFPDLGGGLLWKLFQARYYSWLISRLDSLRTAFSFTVSEDIAKLYNQKFGKNFDFIMNIPTLKPLHHPNRSNLQPKNIRFVYHGASGKGRGIPRLIKAMGRSKGKTELHLIVVASQSRLAYLKTLAKLFGKQKTFFHKPVPFSEIPDMLMEFDAEIIFYHPPHSTNEFLSLPNKFFEAIGSGLAIVTGPSPSMATLVSKYNLGWVVPNWRTSELTECIDNVTHGQLEIHKKATLVANKYLSEQSQRKKFLEKISQVLSKENP